MTLYNSINELIKLSINIRLDNPTTNGVMPAFVYAKEFKTVGMILPRRACKTTAIKEFVTSRPDKSLIVAFNHYSEDGFKGMQGNYDVMSINENIHLSSLALYNHEKYQYILFDEFTHMDESKMDNVYMHTADINNSLQTYIKLGT